MKIDLNQEPLVPLLQAAEFFPVPIRKRQLYRYATPDGSRPVLETIMIGSRKFTSRPAVDRFVKACNGESANC